MTPTAMVYADPRICPDCRRAIGTGDRACPSCGLRLRGQTAQLLFTTLTEADRLLRVLRSEDLQPAAAPASLPGVATTSVAAATTSPVATPVTAVPGAAELPPYPGGTRGPAPRRGLGAASVPKILFTLGAGCLLIAALVFLAVTWSILGVAGRTTVLVLLTGVAAAVSVRMSRAGLRGAAEALAVVAYGLLALDLVGAQNAGWLGGIGDAGFLAVLGSVVGLAGAGGAVLARSRQQRLLTGEVVAAVGTLLASGAVITDGWPTAAALLTATLLAATAGLAWRVLGLRVAEIGAGAAAALWWLGLTLVGLDAVEAEPTWRGLWLDLEVWPLLASAAIAVAVALVPALPRPARVCAAAVAHPLLVVAALAPAAFLPSLEARWLVLVGVLVVTSAATWLLPRPWALVPVVTQVVAGLMAGGLVLTLVARAAERMADAGASAGRWSDALPALRESGWPAGWLLPLAALGLVVAAVSLARAVALGTLLPDAVRVPWWPLAATVALVGAVATLALYPVPVAVLVAVPALAVLALTAWWVADRSGALLGVSVVSWMVALAVGLHAESLTVAVLVVGLLQAGAVHLQAREPWLAPLAGGWLALVLGALVWTGGLLVGAEPTWVALVGVALLGALTLGAPYLPDSWWSSRAVEARTGVELGAVGSALALASAGITLAAPGVSATWAAVYLTLAGGVCAAMSLLRDDRRQVGWLGGLLLAAATWVRLYDVGVRAPEPYTLPSALVLVLVGLHHLRRQRHAATTAALAPGLCLATLPTLLWVLVDTDGWRPLLLGVTALALVLGGVRLRWTAPLVVGAIVGGLLVLRLLAPYEHAVPRWVLIGGAGVLLLAVAVTWERRLADARALASYVRGMR